MTQAPIPADEIPPALEEVLARPEFSDEEGLLARIAGWIWDGLHELFSAVPVPSGDFGWVFPWALGGLVAVLLAWLLLRLRARYRAPEVARRRAAVVSNRVRELRARALSARRAGDLPLALRLTFFALVVGLGRRGDLEYRDSWTNRELLERGRPAGEVSTLLGPLVDELDLKMFGRGVTTEEDVDRLEQLCARWLGGAEVAS